MALPSQFSVINPNRSLDFPEGFGLQSHGPSLGDFHGFVDKNAKQIFQLIRRFGVLIFPETSLEKPREEFISALNKFQPFHFDGCGPDSLQSAWAITHLMLDPKCRDLDGTQFVETRGFSKAMAEGFFDRIRAFLEPTDFINSKMDRYVFSDDAQKREQEKRYREAYAKTPLAFTHSWSEYPKASVLYFSYHLPDGQRVAHGRLNPPQNRPATTPRLRAYPLGRSFPFNFVSSSHVWA